LDRDTFTAAALTVTMFMVCVIMWFVYGLMPIVSVRRIIVELGLWGRLCLSEGKGVVFCDDRISY